LVFATNDIPDPDQKLAKAIEIVTQTTVNIPMEQQTSTVPDTTLIDKVDITLKIEGNALDTFTIENHPKLQWLPLAVFEAIIFNGLP